MHFINSFCNINTEFFDSNSKNWANRKYFNLTNTFQRKYQFNERLLECRFLAIRDRIF